MPPRGKELHAVNPSTVANSQPCAPVYSACIQDGAGGGTRNQAMQRGPVWRDATTPQRIHVSRRQQRQRRTTCSPVHAAPGGLCKFAQIRAVKALRNRPISTTRNVLQELQAAISNGLAAFQSTAGNAAQGIPDRPPGVDTLRLYAVGAKFS